MVPGVATAAVWLLCLGPGCALGPAVPPGVAPAAPEVVATAHVDSSPRRVALDVLAPLSSDVAAVLVVRYPADLPVETPQPSAAAGDEVGAGLVLRREAVGPGGSFSFDDEDPDRCRALIYRAWTVTSSGLLSEAAAAPIADGALRLPTGAPSDLTAIVEAQTVSLAWQNGGGPDFAAARLLRSDAPIVDSSAGEVVYEGPGTSFEDATTGLSGAVFYAVFSCDACGVCDPAGPNASVQL